VLDLAGLVGMNDFGARERRALLEAYAGEEGRPIAEPELERTVRLVRLIAYFWSRLGESSGAGSAAYGALAAEVGARLR
jgi:hypothetical protein